MNIIGFQLQLNKANPSDLYTEAPFLDLDLSITNGIVSINFYDKRDDFNFEIDNFLDGDVPRSPSYGGAHFAAYSFCKNMFFLLLSY